MCSSCEGCCQMAWPLPLHGHKYQPLSVSSPRDPEGGCPWVFPLGYLWELDWLQRDNEVQHQTWLAWTQPEVQKWGLKMSSHTLSEVHYINNPTPFFSSRFTPVLSYLWSLLLSPSSLLPVLTPTALHWESINSPVLPSLIHPYINLSHEELLPRPRDETDHAGQGCEVVLVETQWTSYRSFALCFSQRTRLSFERG